MLKFGLIGTGDITAQFLTAVAEVDGIEGYAIYSRSIDKANQFAKDNNLQKGYDDLSAMLADSEVNCVYIASPNSLHFSQAMKAIEAGKHVMIEKPMTLLPAQITTLYKRAKEANVFIMEAYVSLPYNTLQTVKGWIERIGLIEKVDFHLEQQTRHYQDYLDGKYINVFDSKMGGGAFRDIGPYIVYPLVYLFGVPAHIQPFSTKNELGADETTLCLAFYDEFTAILNASKTFRDGRSNIIAGDEGSIEIDHINGMDNVTLYDVKGNVLETVKADYTNRMTPEVIHFVDVINSGNYNSELYTEELAIAVGDIIAKNYQ